MHRLPNSSTNFDYPNPSNLLSSTPPSTSNGEVAFRSIAVPHVSHPEASPRLYLLQAYVAVAATVVYIGTKRVEDRVEKIPMVARVSVTDHRGNTLLDTYVRPTHHIEDYRTGETGLCHVYLVNAPHFQDVQSRVSDILKGKILVGHSLWIFLSVLGLSHPTLLTRDLALFRPLRKKLKSRHIVSLPALINLFMGHRIGLDYEDSLEIARASMDLFRSCRTLFEQIIFDGAWPCNLPPSMYAEYFT